MHNILARSEVMSLSPITFHRRHGGAPLPRSQAWIWGPHCHLRSPNCLGRCSTDHRPGASSWKPMAAVARRSRRSSHIGSRAIRQRRTEKAPATYHCRSIHRPCRLRRPSAVAVASVAWVKTTDRTRGRSLPGSRSPGRLRTLAPNPTSRCYILTNWIRTSSQSAIERGEGKRTFRLVAPGVSA
jgi:hypothetical protein